MSEFGVMSGGPNCEHASLSGVDQTTGPGKVWRCDACDVLVRREAVPRRGGVSRLVRVVTTAEAVDSIRETKA